MLPNFIHEYSFKSPNRVWNSLWSFNESLVNRSNYRRKYVVKHLKNLWMQRIFIYAGQFIDLIKNAVSMNSSENIIIMKPLPPVDHWFIFAAKTLCKGDWVKALNALILIYIASLRFYNQKLCLSNIKIFFNIEM